MLVAVAAQEYAYEASPARPLLGYFRQWFDREIGELARDEGRAEGPPTDAVAALAGACEGAALLEQPTSLGAETGADGMRREVLRMPGGRLQFVAFSRGRVLLADPQIDCERLQLGRRLEAPLPMLLQPMHQIPYRDVPAVAIDDAATRLLHPASDHLVQDCLASFVGRAAELCSEELEAKALAASVKVVDGLLVQVHTKVQKLGRRPTYHQLACSFKLRGGGWPTRGAADPQGLTVTVLMHVGICEAIGADSVGHETSAALRALETHPADELSVLQGYQGIYRAAAPADTAFLSEAPLHFDLREAYPECFVGDTAADLVRDQGACGSSWAFASASSLSTNLCIAAGAGAEGRRREVSVQRVMSCNGDGAFGCQGGHALAAAWSFEMFRIGEEASTPYRCGPQSSLPSPVEGAVCEAPPWGGDARTCGDDFARDGWSFHGLRAVRGGPQEIARLLASGRALYASIRVHENLVGGSPPEVYNETVGVGFGGHAVVLLGYGVAKGGMPYWLLQNSWGPLWADGGFFKMLRGANLAGVEEHVLYFAAVDEPALASEERGVVPMPVLVAAAALLFAAGAFCRGFKKFKKPMASYIVLSLKGHAPERTPELMPHDGVAPGPLGL